MKVYITPDGARTLRDELTHIWKVMRPETTKIVSAAAALGDRSENADYIYGKKRLREIDKRIRYLTKRLENRPTRKRFILALGLNLKMKTVRQKKSELLVLTNSI